MVLFYSMTQQFEVLLSPLCILSYILKTYLQLARMGHIDNQLGYFMVMFIMLWSLNGILFLLALLFCSSGMPLPRLRQYKENKAMEFAHYKDGHSEHLITLIWTIKNLHPYVTICTSFMYI